MLVYNAEPPVAALHQSITAPSDDALMVTVPLPQREFGITSGLVGNGFSIMLCVPFIAAAQFPPSATDVAVYVPATLNAPLNVAALPVPFNVPTSVEPLYNWYFTPSCVLDNANITPIVEPAQKPDADASSVCTAGVTHSIAVTAFVRVKSQ